MSTATLIERIAGRRRAAEQKSVESYQELVAAAADEQDVDPARADAVLLDSAHSPTDLERDVAELRQRRADAEIAARLPGLRREYETACNGQQSLREALREFEQKWRRETHELAVKANALKYEIQDCEAAERRLRAGRPDPRRGELLAQRNQLSARRNELTAALGNKTCGLVGALDSRRRALAAGPQNVETTTGLQPSILGRLFNAQELQLEIDKLELDVRGRQAELADVEQKLAAVGAELDGIERRQLSAE